MEIALPATSAAANTWTNFLRTEPSQWENSPKFSQQSPRLWDWFLHRPHGTLTWPRWIPPAVLIRETRTTVHRPPPQAPQSATRLQQARQPRPICWMRPKSLPLTTNTTVTETTIANERLMRARNPQLKKLLLRLLASLEKHTQLS